MENERDQKQVISLYHKISGSEGLTNLITRGSPCEWLLVVDDFWKVRLIVDTLGFP